MPFVLGHWPACGWHLRGAGYSHRSADESGAFERLYVLGCSGEAHPEGCRELPNRKLALGQPSEHAAAGGIGQRVKYGIQALLTLFNHSVERSLCASLNVNR